MRILHGPVNVGNQPWSVSRAERALGHSSGRPEYLVDDIVKVLERQADWGALSAKSIQHVRKWHDPSRVARYLTEIYKEPRKYRDFGQFIAREG